MTDQAISRLRRRLIEDMTIRKLAPKTQASYIRAVRDFTGIFGRRFKGMPPLLIAAGQLTASTAMMLPVALIGLGLAAIDGRPLRRLRRGATGPVAFSARGALRVRLRPAGPPPTERGDQGFPRRRHRAAGDRR
jgi:hypothetical protein